LLLSLKWQLIYKFYDRINRDAEKLDLISRSKSKSFSRNETIWKAITRH